ncbi:arsenate reductase ArsC [Nocardioides eburneiflavus]|uniref:Arsenate reductase ArsC n=1 Tax=Nocardioides eburneiflavus TaxID=2518372 RepID=A0A4Z1CJF1_9ACTN|nr:arsenate reductase ArsC [Nocardioides eburneiflavus]TGN63390.1 arsenate reductase ArsC [Nocardioides eburneiflavus]
MTDTPRPTPTVLFVCVHNAGRSQMAAGWLRHLAGDRVEVLSAGSAPAGTINPVAVEAMAEVGIDIASQQPKLLSDTAVQASDVVITMGCGDACPFYPGKRYEDWKLDDPAGQGIESVRPIRDEIKRRVEELIESLA